VADSAIDLDSVGRTGRRIQLDVCGNFWGESPMHSEIIVIMIVCWQAQQGQKATPSGVVAENLEVRYARAQVQLAETNLKRLEQSNKRMPRSVPSSVVAEYQHDLQVAKTRLQQATAGQAASDFQVWLQRADVERRAAEMTWKNATAANARAPGTFHPLDIERYRLRAEVAKLQLERGQLLVDSGQEAQLQWEIDLLDNQVQRQKDETSRATTFIGFYPLWRW
jgi:hypothetical protein